MKVEDVYISPNDEVFVTNFAPDSGISWHGPQYHLEVGKWYKLAQEGINFDYFIDVIHGDGKSIPHKPENFMSKSEWREMQLKKIL